MTCTNHADHERAIDELVTRGLAALPDVREARGALDELARLHGDRAVFALCLLTLELARAGDALAREELPDHVGVLLEAWQDPALATLLTAGNQELAARWERVRPIVGEFVQLKQGTPQRRLTPGPIPRLATPVELMIEIQEMIETPCPAPPSAAVPRHATPVETLEIEEVIEEQQPLPPVRPAPLARQATPFELLDIQEIIEEVRPAAPPPPPPPAALLGARPPPPPPPPAACCDPEPPPLDEQTRLFWRFAEEALGRAPSPDMSLIGKRSFAAEKSADRTRLVRFAHSTLARFPCCEHARALAALVLLYAGSQEKERGLLGVNRERLEALRTGLSLLGDPGPAASVAVLFENDGPLTVEHFAGVVDLVSSYLGFCAREGLDPRMPETQARFCSPG
jgi:hypothetical protein